MLHVHEYNQEIAECRGVMRARGTEGTHVYNFGECIHRARIDFLMLLISRDDLSCRWSHDV